MFVKALLGVKSQVMQAKTLSPIWTQIEGSQQQKQQRWRAREAECVRVKEALAEEWLGAEEQRVRA